MITRTKTQNSRADFLPWAHVIFELTLVRESFRGSIIQNTKRVVVSRTRRDTRLLIEILDIFYIFVFVFFFLKIYHDCGCTRQHKLWPCRFFFLWDRKQRFSIGIHWYKFSHQYHKPHLKDLILKLFLFMFFLLIFWWIFMNY